MVRIESETKVFLIKTEVLLVKAGIPIELAAVSTAEFVPVALDPFLPTAAALRVNGLVLKMACEIEVFGGIEFEPQFWILEGAAVVVAEHVVKGLTGVGEKRLAFLYCQAVRLLL